jgi:hypothetical protein
MAPARKPASGTDAEAEADGDRGEHGQQARRGQLTQRVAGADVDDLAVLGLLGALHDPGVVAELAAHLVDDRARGPGHGVDGQAGEQEHDRGADEQADEVARVGGTPRYWPSWARFPSASAGLTGLEGGGGDRLGYEPNRAVAARTAVAIAMPLVMALVVLPTASSSVRICAPPRRRRRPDISAMPWALSETGPKVSMATMTPTVVSRPVPASAMANSDSTTDPPPSRNAA